MEKCPTLNFLIEKGANANDDSALRLSARNNHLAVVTFLKARS